MKPILENFFATADDNAQALYLAKLHVDTAAKKELNEALKALIPDIEKNKEECEAYRYLAEKKIKLTHLSLGYAIIQWEKGGLSKEKAKIFYKFLGTHADVKTFEENMTRFSRDGGSVATAGALNKGRLSAQLMSANNEIATLKLEQKKLLDWIERILGLKGLANVASDKWEEAIKKANADREERDRKRREQEKQQAILDAEKRISADFQEQIKKLKDDLAKAHTATREAKSALETEKSGRVTDAEEANQKLQALQSKIVSVNNEHGAELESLKKAHKAEVSRLQGMVTQLQDQAKLHEGELERAKLEATKAKAEVSRLQGMVAQLQGQLDNANKRIKGLEDELAAAVTETQKLQKQLGAALEKHKTDESLINSLRNAVKELNAEVTRLTGELAAKEDKLKLIEINTNTTREDPVAQAALQKLREENAQLRKALLKAESELKTANDVLEAMRKQHEASKAEVARLGEALRRETENVKRLEGDLGAMKKQFEASKAEVARLEGELKLATDTVRGHERDLDNMRRQRDAYGVQVKELGEELRLERIKVARLEGELVRQRARGQLVGGHAAALGGPQNLVPAPDDNGGNRFQRRHKRAEELRETVLKSNPQAFR